MKSKIRSSETVYVLVGVGMSTLFVLALAYAIYSSWK